MAGGPLDHAAGVPLSGPVFGMRSHDNQIGANVLNELQDFRMGLYTGLQDGLMPGAFQQTAAERMHPFLLMFSKSPAPL